MLARSFPNIYSPVPNEMIARAREIAMMGRRAPRVDIMPTSVSEGKINAPTFVVELYVPDNITIAVPKTLAFFPFIIPKLPVILHEVDSDKLIFFISVKVF